MEPIASFTINHLELLRGIYVSRKDNVGEEVLTTFDIRMVEPNRQEALSPESIHTIEHLAATYVRNDSVWADRVVYWGPMGCLTGNYFIVKGDFQPKDILPLVRNTFRFITEYEGEIPGAKARDCGNWTLHDLAQAKRDAAKYLEEVLLPIKDENMRYPQEL